MARSIIAAIRRSVTAFMDEMQSIANQKERAYSELENHAHREREAVTRLCHELLDICDLIEAFGGPDE